MQTKRWTWQPSEYPDLLRIIETDEFRWSKLEDAGDYHKGIVFVVCAAISMAREAVSSISESELNPNNNGALEILEDWIDDQSEKNFDRVSEILYAKDNNDEFITELSAPVWWALRCATSHPDGCGEIDWAMEALLEEAEKFGVNKEQLSEAGRKGLITRMSGA